MEDVDDELEMQISTDLISMCSPLPYVSLDECSSTAYSDMSQLTIVRQISDFEMGLNDSPIQSKCQNRGPSIN